MPSIHTAEEEDTTSPNNAQETPNDDPQPSRHPQRKPTRRVFGIQQRGFQAGGNDTFDYEQRFPEDKQYEELGPLARVWRTYLAECAGFDAEMLEGWRDGLDVLLVFAGLFSAVVTTFVIQTSQNLQINYGQVTAMLLFELTDVQRSGQRFSRQRCSSLRSYSLLGFSPHII
ncbi:hypothetical protein ARMGADRAFT_1091924 [Armillaria gallica]|uniref:DUF6535 domain-containing protein n=1 Tax=Armillaria gallica TaxID=47427 RepID=A0A2H3CHD9_ARMGA|nr:hypothetical protein ARMGADRAFT_1091924 [Armillaria gallica]